MIRFLSVNSSDSNVPAPAASLRASTSLDGYHLRRGLKITREFPKLVIWVEDAHPDERPPGLTDFFSTIPADIVSKKMADVMTEAVAEVQLFPVAIAYRNQMIVGQFFAVNCLRRIKCLDILNSDLDVDSELGVVAARSVKLDESRLVDVNWSVVDELGRIVLSQKMQDAITEVGCVGHCFVDSGSYNF